MKEGKAELINVFHGLQILGEYVQYCLLEGKWRDQYLPDAHVFCPCSFTGAARGHPDSAHPLSQRHSLVSTEANVDIEFVWILNHLHIGEQPTYNEQNMSIMKI